LQGILYIYVTSTITCKSTIHVVSTVCLLYFSDKNLSRPTANTTNYDKFKNDSLLNEVADWSDYCDPEIVNIVVIRCELYCKLSSYIHCRKSEIVYSSL